MATPIPDDLKKRIESKIANRPNLEILDPGTVWTNPDGNVFVAVMDTATLVPLWIAV
jgi:hypothetical protein